MKQLSLSTLFFLALSITISCSIDGANERLLVNASGRPGELFVVMDSVQWKGELGEVIRNELVANVPGLATDEPYFTVRYIEPTRFNSVLNKTKNIVFVATLDSKTKGGETVRGYITGQYIKDNPTKYIISQTDLYAKGQTVLYLFGNTAEKLTGKINQNQGVLRNFFIKVERERLDQSLYKAKEKTGINNTLLKKHSFYMRIPNGYRIEDNVPGFVWLRSPGVTDGSFDKNIFVSYKPYASESSFEKKEIIGWRNRITKEHVYEDPDSPASYMEADTVNVPLVYKTTKINGNFAKEIRGIWRMHNFSIGGPYIGYIVLDEESNQLFYIDGFVVAPGEPKRDAINELEAIINTFKTKYQMAAIKKSKEKK